MPESEYNFRLAEPADAPAFAKWAAENPQIDPKDIQDSLKKNSPTSVTFVVEKHGVPVVFAPLVCIMRLCHLGFNPLAEGRDKLEALEFLKSGVMAFAVQFGVREIETLTMQEYPVARWADKHGFDVDDRIPYRLDINKVMVDNTATVEGGKPCAHLVTNKRLTSKPHKLR